MGVDTGGARVWRWARRLGRRGRWTIAVATALPAVLVLGAAGYAATVAVPRSLTLASTTTIYYADGRTVLARLGEQVRIVVDTATLPDHVAAAVLAAEDPHFHSRGSIAGPSPVAVQSARLLTGLPKGRSPRLAVVAMKLERRYTRARLLDYYLNAVYFGRGAYGVEAAAIAYFGKPARALTVAEAMVLAAVIRSPGDGRYDPAVRVASARQRWEQVRDRMVDPMG